MRLFSIGHPHGDRIEVDLIELFMGRATHPLNAWAIAEVRIEIGGFSGTAKIFMDVSDMTRFGDELEPMYRNVSGTAEFKTTENQFYVRLEMDNLGHVEASGFLSDNDLTNTLTFEFSSDQTSLVATLSEIRTALLGLNSQISN